VSASPIAHRGVELLDRPEADPEQVRQNLRHISRANRWFGGHASLRYALRRLLGKQPSGTDVSLLDIGTGAGDLPAAAVAWGRRRGLAIRPIALERLRPAAAVATSRGLPTILGCASALPLRARSVDLVLVSQVLHHFHRDAARDLIAACDRVACVGVMILDLQRTAWAVPAFSLGGRLLRFDPVTLRDGVTSIRRGYTADELDELLRAAGVRATVASRPFSRLVAHWATAAR